MQNPKLKILLELFTHRVSAAVRYVSGRSLSLAELGAIREQCAAILRSAFLAGMLERHNRISAHFEPWDIENDPTDPYIQRPPHEK